MKRFIVTIDFDTTDDTETAESILESFKNYQFSISEYLFNAVTRRAFTVIEDESIELTSIRGPRQEGHLRRS